MLVLSIFSPRNVSGRWPQSWFEFLGIVCLIAACVAIVICILQIIRGNKIDPFAIDIVICNKCHNVKHRDSNDKCECGGTFEDFDNWTWIDE